MIHLAPCRNRRDTPCVNANWRQDFSYRQFVVVLPFRETEKPPLFVPVFRNMTLYAGFGLVYVAIPLFFAFPECVYPASS